MGKSNGQIFRTVLYRSLHLGAASPPGDGSGRGSGGEANGQGVVPRSVLCGPFPIMLASSTFVPIRTSSSGPVTTFSLWEVKSSLGPSSGQTCWGGGRWKHGRARPTSMLSTLPLGPVCTKPVPSDTSPEWQPRSSQAIKLSYFYGQGSLIKLACRRVGSVAFQCLIFQKAGRHYSPWPG